ncbi:MAG TPA: 3-deoxy-D-manno-octulosonic acid transferase [Kiritimatiellia bacterium]|nr:3-deoxy-D-manno-octulosonic acid transferase [Kiritimatiellia bacterium]HMO98232.1 3-deoxy-D-manno-octulosonic acid transferase [Kiritimatiellia bacterium]HMP97191.1 3-deoxy-D-manno-octulosonic acid transferase [Kiritimatiellia bacterium]
MIWKIYNLLFALIFPLLLPHFFWRMKRRGGYSRNFGQRLGFYSDEVLRALGGEPRVWLHAVSVGELYVALCLIREWREREPDVRFALTVTTSTAYAIAERELSAADVVLYFPVDFPPVMRRAFAVINPRALVLVEVELWPNLIRMARRRSLPVFLVNGRMSDRSFRGYSRLKALTRPLLAEFDVISVQSEEDRKRFIALGADPARTVHLGSAKYDVALTTPLAGGEKALEVMRAAGIRPDHLVLLGGSTWDGEEEAMVDLYRGLKTRYRNLVLMIAPRHVERLPALLEILKPKVGKLVRRSTITETAAVAPAQPPDVLLIDTTGELKHFYAHADVIFVGKSLTQHGGQNIIEPALYGKPVIVGPNMENFIAILADFLAEDAVVQVKDLQGLRRAVDDLLCDPGKRDEIGQAARRVVESQSGSLGQFLDCLFDAGFSSR